MASYKGQTITGKTDAEVAREVAAIDAGSLTKQKQFELTQPKPSTEATGMLAYLGSSADSFTKNLAESAKQRETAFSASQNALVDAIMSGKSEELLQHEAYATTVDPLEAELKDINQQILAEQVSLQRQQEALDKNPQGLFGGALADEKARIERDSLRKQADLSVIQLARQGRYDSAKAIADRAVAAQFAYERNKLEALKLTYEGNKDLFSKAEQRAFESAQGDRERTLDLEASKELARYQQMLDDQSGGSTGALDADISAYTQALQAGTVTLAQVPQKIRGQVLANAQSTGTNKLIGLLEQYRDRVKGLNWLTANLPENRALLDTLKGQITAVYKQQQQLGTLDNGVQRLVDRIIPDPANLSITSLSNSAQIDAIDNFIANQGGTDSFMSPLAPGATGTTTSGVKYTIEPD